MCLALFSVTTQITNFARVEVNWMVRVFIEYIDSCTRSDVFV